MTPISRTLDRIEGVFKLHDTKLKIQSQVMFSQAQSYHVDDAIWFKHILFRRKGLGVAYKATMPSPEEAFTKEPNHTHICTHTLDAI